MLPEIINNSLRNNGFLPERDSFVLGVSGGVDSMVMMFVFNKLGYSFTPVHINYHKRGAESDKDQALVEEKAAEYGLNPEVHQVYPADAKGNFQEWARKERYRIFRQTAYEHHAAAIVVAHHMDDQLETILQKILRGSGMDSWVGMSEFDGEIFRPMLPVGREEIMQFAVANNISFRHDQSNFESGYARNFIRNQWMPRMNTLFPGWQSNILRVQERALLFDESISILASQIQSSPGLLKRDEFLKFSIQMQEAIIQHMVKSLFGREASISISALENLGRIEDLQTGGRLQLQKNIYIIRNRDQFILENVEDVEEDFTPIPLTYDQLYHNPFELNGLRLEIKKSADLFSKDRLQLNLTKKDFPVEIRRWQDGDKFQPLGMMGHQKISDHLTNKKVDASKKNEAIVILSFEQIICAVIFPHSENLSMGSISEKVKCNDTTEEALVIEKI